MTAVHFEGLEEGPDGDAAGRRAGLDQKEASSRSMLSAPSAPPDQHRRASIQFDPNEFNPRLSVDEAGMLGSDGGDGGARGRRHRKTLTAFGGVSKSSAYREIRQSLKNHYIQDRDWTGYDPNSAKWSVVSMFRNRTVSNVAGSNADLSKDVEMEKGVGEGTSLLPPLSITVETENKPLEALKMMFLENKINVLLVFLPLACWSHAAKWSDGSIFILNFLAMVPLASMLGVFTEELAAHTNAVIGGLINATFGNAVELVVAIQALLANDFRVVQASLIGSVFSNLLLVLGMCFFMGGLKFPEQTFIAQGAVASVALLAFCGLTLLMPSFFGEDSESDGDVELKISRIGAVLLICMYGQMLYFQLKTHVHLFEGDDDDVALIPFNWALIGLVVITAIVTILSEFLVGSIDGFCEEFNLGRSFVGVIILPVVGNAVEHISAVSVAMKNKMDLALGVALGSAVQIALLVLPVTVLIGWFTDRDMSMKFPSFEIYLYLLSVIIVALCLQNQRSNWLEGSLLVFTYVIIAIGIYFENDVVGQ